MEQKDLNRFTLSKLLGTSHTTVGRWLGSDGFIPRAHTIRDLARILCVNAQWLLHGDGEMEAAPQHLLPRDQLRSARLAKGLTVKDLAKKVGYSIDVYQEIEEGRSQMGEKMAHRVAEALDLPVSSLLGGSDHPADKGIPIGTFGAVPDILLPQGLKAKYVPLLSMAQCGTMRAYSDEIYTHQGFLAFNVTDPKTFAVTLAGESMMPDLKPGDVAIVSPGAPLKNGKPVLAKLNPEHGEDVMLKLYHSSGDQVTLTSVNPAYPPLQFPRSSFEWIYRVTNVNRSY